MEKLSVDNNKSNGKYVEAYKRYKKTMFTIVKTNNSFKITIGRQIVIPKSFKTINEAEKYLDDIKDLDFIVGVASILAFNLINNNK